MHAQYSAVIVSLVWGLLYTAAAPAWAQTEGVVRGQVLASADASPIPHASLSLARVAGGESLQVTADADGRFVFPSIRPGEYVLSTSADGFSASEVRLFLEPREIRIVTLALDVRRLEVNVTVTVTAQAPAGTHSPSSTVVSAARVDDLPIPQRTGLADALVTLAPGMIRGHDDFVHIRGHEVALNPVIDGVSFWENPHSLFSGGLSPEVIETANVMTGGFPAEYGNRFGGVVDIVTKSGSRMQEKGTITGHAGQAGRKGLSGELGGRRERLGYYIFGSAFGTQRFLSAPDVRAIHDSGGGAHAFVQLDGDFGGGGALRTVFGVDGANFDIPKTPLDLELRPLAEPRQRTRQQTAILGWTSEGPDTFVSASGYQRWSRVRLLPAEGPLTAEADLTRELLTIGAKGDVTRSVGLHTFKTGVDVVRLGPRERLAYDYAGYQELTHLLALPHLHVTDQRIAFEGRDAGGQVSGFFQDTLQIGRRLTADVGVRVDHYDLLVSATHASPRLNLALRTRGAAVLHASYNRFFVPPPVEGVLSSSAGLTRSIQEIGAELPPLRASVEDQFELGLTSPLEHIRFALSAYARRTENPVHTTVWPDSRVYSYASFDRARAYGLEVKAEARGLARYGTTAYVNYALGRVHFYNPVTGGFLTEAAHLTDTSRFLGPMDQTHTLTGGVTYTHATTGLWVGTAVEYGSGTPVGHGGGDHEHDEAVADHAHAVSTGGGRVPGHFTANLSAGIDLLRTTTRRPRLTLRVDVENVGNRAYLIAQEGEFSPTQYSIPRLASVTARVRF